MFHCSKCESLEAEVKYLRETNQKLLDRFVAMPNLQAYAPVQYGSHDPKEFFGNGEDEEVAYDQQTGATIYVTKKKEG